MALGVEAAGRVAAVGDGVAGIAVGDAVTTHSLPLRGQGCWAQQHLAAAADVALIPPGVPWDAAAALPGARAHRQPGAGHAGHPAGRGRADHGAGGVTGQLLVQLAVRQGHRVIATRDPAARPGSAPRGACAVLDYHDPDWPGQVRR